MFFIRIRMLSHATNEHLRGMTEYRSNRDQLPDGYRLHITFYNIYKLRVSSTSDTGYDDVLLSTNFVRI